MPIIGWFCKACRANVPLSHFEDGCNHVHPDYAAAVLADSLKERADGVHVTGVLGCPRRAAMEVSAEVYIDPLTCNAILSGTAWHSLMQSASNRPDLCEVDVSGTVGGVLLTGRVDRLHPPTAISDWKRTSEWAEKWLRQPREAGGGMKAEHLAQLSIYGELVHQSLGWRPTHGIVWYSMHKSMVYFAEQLWPVEQVLGFHPLGGEFSVAELIQQAASGADWRELPLAGESQSYGQKSACDYCAMREPCWAQAKGAPF